LRKAGFLVTVLALTLAIAGIAYAEAFMGTTGPDRYIGTDEVVLVELLAGDEYAEGRGAADKIFAGRGDDDIFGQAGTDVLYGGGGNDKLVGGPGEDELFGSGGNDVIVVASGPDHQAGSITRSTCEEIRSK